MKTIAIINRKGGVGKSTVATHLAGALACAGSRVLLIDTDPQGNAAIMLGLRKGAGLYNLLVDSADFQDVCHIAPSSAIAPGYSTISGELRVLPSDEKTQVIPLLVKNPFALAQRLDEIAEAFDYVIIDTAPTITMFDGAVMLAADAVLYVTECEKLSLEGLQSGLRELREAIPQRQGYQIPPIHILGIVPNKLRENTAAFRIMMWNQAHLENSPIHLSMWKSRFRGCRNAQAPHRPKV